MKKSDIIILCILIFIFLAIPVYSFIANSFDVNIVSEFHDLTNHEIIIEIQNLDSLSDRNFNLGFYLKNMNFDKSKVYDVYIYELKPVLKEYPVYDVKLIEKSCYNNQTENYYDCSYNENYIKEYVYKNVLEWKPTKMNLITQADKISTEYGNINIPKLTSKCKYDDEGKEYDCNGMKKFKITWKTPIVKSSNGWGSYGYFAVYDKLSGIDYDPTWLTDWSKRKNITIQYSGGQASISNLQVMLNVTYDSDMKSDFGDLRFTDSTTTEIDYYLQRYVASSYAEVWIEIPTITNSANVTISMYYGNAGVSTTSNIDNTFIQSEDMNDVSEWATGAYGGGTFTATTAKAYGGSYSGNQTKADGQSEYTLYRSISSLGTTKFIETLWFYHGTDTGRYDIVMGADNGGATYSWQHIINNGAYIAYDSNGNTRTVGNPTDNAWNRVDFFVDNTTEKYNFTVLSEVNNSNMGFRNGNNFYYIVFNNRINAYYHYWDDILFRTWHEQDKTPAYAFLTEETSSSEKPPLWSSNQTSIVINYSFVPSTFNITWANGSAGTVVNTSYVLFYSNFTNDTMSLISGNGLSGVYGYQEVIPVGSWWWYIYAKNNESSPQSNNTDVWYFTISKALANCSLSISPSSPINYGTDVTATCICQSEGTTKLERNGTDITAQNNSAVTLGAGIYNYSCSIPSSTNYSAASNMSNFIVNKVPILIDVYINGDLNQNTTIGYGSLLNVTGVRTCDICSDFNIWKNGTLVNYTMLANTTVYYYNSSEPQDSVYEFKLNASAGSSTNYTTNDTGATFFVTISSTLSVDVLDEQTENGITFNITIQNNTFSTTEYDKNIFTSNATNMPFGDVTIIVWASGYTQRIFYTYLNSSSTETKVIYLLSNSYGQNTVFYVKNYNGEILPNTEINILKLLSTGWEIVSQGRTDDAGSHPFFLNPTNIYRINIQYENMVRNITQIPALTSYTFYIGSNDTYIPSYWTFYKNLVADCSYDNSTRLLTCPWNDGSGHLTSVLLIVTRKNTSHSWTHCNNTSTSSSGTIYCNFGTPNNNTFTWSFRGYTSSEASSLLLASGSWTDSMIISLGLTGVFIAFLIVLLCSFIGVQIENPIFTVLMTLLGVGVSFLFGLLDFPGIILTLFIGLTISGGILIYKLR